jgi:hypothetical protein
MLSYKDLDQMQAFGRIYAKTAQRAPLNDAVDFWEIADDAEKVRLHVYFSEGVRNNCDGMYHYQAVMDQFDLLCFQGARV